MRRRLGRRGGRGQVREGCLNYLLNIQTHSLNLGPNHHFPSPFLTPLPSLPRPSLTSLAFSPNPFPTFPPSPFPTLPHSFLTFPTHHAPSLLREAWEGEGVGVGVGGWG